MGISVDVVSEKMTGEIDEAYSESEYDLDVSLYGDESDALQPDDDVTLFDGQLLYTVAVALILAICLISIVVVIVRRKRAHKSKQNTSIIALQENILPEEPVLGNENQSGIQPGAVSDSDESVGDEMYQ